MDSKSMMRKSLKEMRQSFMEIKDHSVSDRLETYLAQHAIKL